jgi:hypothetical protein
MHCFQKSPSKKCSSKYEVIKSNYHPKLTDRLNAASTNSGVILLQLIYRKLILFFNRSSIASSFIVMK